MRKSIVLLCSIAVLLVSALLPLTVSAERVVLEDNERIAEVFAHCVDYSGQSGASLIGVDCYYASGHHKNNADFIACELYVGGTVYGYSINYAAATPAHNSWTVAGYPSFGAHWLKLGNYQFWYNAGSSSAASYQLDAFCSNHAEFYNTVSNGVSNYDMTYNINVTYMDTSGSDGSFTVQDFADSATADVSPDPTESETEAPAVDSSAEPAFTLPEEWVNGGETLAPGQVETFGDVDQEEALNVLESVNFDEVTNNTGISSAMGFIWAMTEEFLSSFGLSAISLVIIVLLILAWAFGRSI